MIFEPSKVTFRELLQYGDFTGDVDGQDGYSSPVPVTLHYDPVADAFIGSVALRAERDGGLLGRTYAVTCEVWDFANGNRAATDCVVVVPHDLGKKGRN